MNKKNNRIFAGFTLMNRNSVREDAFTLIELLVVISIMGILLALSIFGMQSARQASRDGKRKSDIEQIRSALEMYKSDCNSYPVSITAGASLKGTGSPTTCSSSNTYLSIIPTDPLPSEKSYYYSSDGVTYVICSSLEQSSTAVSGCGSCGTTCNYKVTNP